MAKPLVVHHNGTDLTFGLSRLERSKLYGSRQRVALDAQERPCVRAALTADGATLLKIGMTGQGHFTADGWWMVRGEMVGLDATGATVESRPSALRRLPLQGAV